MTPSVARGRRFYGGLRSRAPLYRESLVTTRRSCLSPSSRGARRHSSNLRIRHSAITRRAPHFLEAPCLRRYGAANALVKRLSSTTSSALMRVYPLGFSESSAVIGAVSMTGFNRDRVASGRTIFSAILRGDDVRRIGQSKVTLVTRPLFTIDSFPPWFPLAARMPRMTATRTSSALDSRASRATFAPFSDYLRFAGRRIILAISN